MPYKIKVHAHSHLTTDQLSKIQIRCVNDCFIYCLPHQISCEHQVRNPSLFGRFGTILNVNLFKSGHGRKQTQCVIISYSTKESAQNAIQWVNAVIFKCNNQYFKSKASHGIQKYCSSLIRNQLCSRDHCRFRHSFCKKQEVVSVEEQTKWQQKQCGFIRDKFVIDIHESIDLNTLKLNPTRNPSRVAQNTRLNKHIVANTTNMHGAGILNRNIMKSDYRTNQKPQKQSVAKHRSKAIKIRNNKTIRVFGIPHQISSESALRRMNLFGQFGDILGITIGHDSSNKSAIWAQIQYDGDESAEKALIWSNNVIFQSGNQCLKAKAMNGWNQKYRCSETQLEEDDIISIEEQKRFEEMKCGVIGHSVYNIDLNGTISVHKMIELYSENQLQTSKNDALKTDIKRLKKEIIGLGITRRDDMEQQTMKYNKLQHDLSVIRLNSEEMKLKNRELCEDIGCLKEDLTEAEAQNKSKQKEIDALLEEVTLLRKEINRVVVDQIETNQAKNELLWISKMQSTQITDLVNELDFVKHELDKKRISKTSNCQILPTLYESVSE